MAIQTQAMTEKSKNLQEYQKISTEYNQLKTDITQTLTIVNENLKKYIGTTDYMYGPSEDDLEQIITDNEGAFLKGWRVLNGYGEYYISRYSITHSFLDKVGINKKLSFQWSGHSGTTWHPMSAQFLDFYKGFYDLYKLIDRIENVDNSLELKIDDLDVSQHSEATTSTAMTVSGSSIESLDANAPEVKEHLFNKIAYPVKLTMDTLKVKCFDIVHKQHIENTQKLTEQQALVKFESGIKQCNQAFPNSSNVDGMIEKFLQDYFETRQKLVIDEEGNLLDSPAEGSSLLDTYLQNQSSDSTLVDLSGDNALQSVEI